ncbi:MAG: adenylate/guanylate cyclase family protein [Mycobacterium sp.]|nr:adenylate/guanylate cyclase family protein [Mycobacterium sp.]
MGTGERRTSVDELIDRAVAAINRGDRVTATALAGQVLAVDGGNSDAEDLLAAPRVGGEIRRLTILFADLVDSTALSTQVEPETYRLLVGRYREQVLSIVNRFEGHIGSTKGDGLLAVFGHPRAHENDVSRAVLAGLQITREVARLREQAQRRFGVNIDVRVGVHRGLVYLDTSQDDVYGLAANLAARVSGLAAPGTVVISDAVAPLISEAFELQARPAAAVKGVDGLIVHHQVLAERVQTPRSGQGPLVGRGREQGRLAKSWARAQAGTLSTPGIVFRGEAGIGKSRLAAAAAELVEASGAVVLELTGSPFHTDAGLHPVRTLLERHCGIGRLTDPAARLRLLKAELARRVLDPVGFVPMLAPVLGIGSDAGYEPVPAEGRKLYGLIAVAVQRYLVACLGSGPALLVAEDLHWFDPSTLEILGSLLDAGEGRLLVVMTGRPGRWLPDSWPVKVFDLKPLTDEQTNALIVALNPSLTAEDRALVRGRCDGVPFYIEQVVDGLTSTPRDPDLGPRVDVAHEPQVPEALYEPLFARLRASANVVPVVEAAAIIGRHVDHSLLGAVCTLDEADLDDVIDELEDALVLEPWGADGWRFRHELLREVAAEMAPPSVRRGLHARVADALVGADQDWGLIAVHYEHAERFDDAASAYQQASTDARRRGSLAEARTYLTNALAWLDRAAPGRDRDRREMAVRLRRGLLTATARGYPVRAAAEDFERCLQLGGTDLRDDELVATLFALAIYYGGRADLRRAEQVLASLRAGVGEERQWFRSWIDVLSGVMTWARGEFSAARAGLEHANEELAATDEDEIDAVWFMPHDPIATSHIHLGLSHFVGGDVTGADAELAQAVRRAEQTAFPRGPYSLANARFLEGWMRIESGRLDWAALLASGLSDLGEQHGFDQWRVVGAAQEATVRALAALGAGDQDPSGLSVHIESVTRFVDTWRTFDVSLYLTFYDSVLARLLIAAGKPEQANARLNIALSHAHDTGMSFYDAELLRLRARTHTEHDAGQADIAAALELARRQGAAIFELRTAVDDFELRGEVARQVLADAIKRFPEGSDWPELARARDLFG